MVCHHLRRLPILPLLAFVAVTSLGACSDANAPAAATPSGTPSDPGSGALTTSGPSGADPGGGGAGSGGTGVGVAPPANPTPVNPAADQPALVTPVPGRLNPHPVVPTALQASVDGHHVLVKVSWYGGVEPCSVLDSVVVKIDGTDIAVTPVEGASDLDAMCIEIAVLKATIVDLGDLAPGTYRIASPGSDAAAVEITIA
jgi:hypothetical protein